MRNLINILVLTVFVMSCGSHNLKEKTSTNFEDFQIHDVASDGDIENLKILIQRGADLNAKNDEGWSPLHYAVGENHLEVVKLLLDAGANVNVKENRGISPLDFASMFGFFEIMKLPVAKGADLNAKDNEGWKVA